MATAFRYSPNELVKKYKALRERVQEELADDGPAKEELARIPTVRSKPSTGRIQVACVQLSASSIDDNDVEAFSKMAMSAIQEAVTKYKADLVLVSELWLSGPYFGQSQDDVLMELAEDNAQNCWLVKSMQLLAAKLGVALPVSLFERKNNTLYNSVVFVDADGSVLGTYRKSHIPDGTGYQEKFYFSPGDTGFKVFSSCLGIKFGVGICWDQWFPETARICALQGADVMLYPTAIGTEPQDPSLDSATHWQRVMQGHAAANMIPVVAANRYGTEILLEEDGTERQRIHFYGRSFITDETGAIVAEANTSNDDVAGSVIITTEFDPHENRRTRLAWGVFRDRRPELYGALLTKDGSTRSSSVL